MTFVRISGFQHFKDRHGKWRCYHRKSRTPVDLERCPWGSAEFFAECQRIVATTVVPAPRPGTFGLLVVAYKGSADYLNLSRQTKINYDGKLDYLRPLSSVPLVRIDRPFVVKVRDKARERGDSFANYVKAVLSVVLRWGGERGYLDGNPASGIKAIRIRRDADPNRPWSDEERYAVLEALPVHMRMPIGLLMFAGLGPKDALSLSKDRICGGEISTRRSKTGEPLFLPMPETLAKIMRDAPEHSATTVCANSAGMPWTPSGFRASWRPIRKRLEEAGRVQPGLTLYGLRHTVAVILRESGFDERTIADYLGQRTIEMARHYSKGADLQPKMRHVAAEFEVELNKRRSPVVKPSQETVKPDPLAGRPGRLSQIKSVG